MIPGALQVPAVVHELAGPDSITAAWRNELGGLTFKLGSDRFVKWTPTDSGIDLSLEAERLRWAREWITVPQVLGQGENWLLTRTVEGRMAVLEEWKARPTEAVRGLALGLRQLHDRLPVEDCPFSWQVPDRLTRAGSSSSECADPPPIDRLVVCHGDACAPNTLLHPDGRPAGHVDLGSLGLADRWADIAVATMSLEWNYGPGYEGLFLDTYGVRPDPVRTAYYRMLWDHAD